MLEIEGADRRIIPQPPVEFLGDVDRKDQLAGKVWDKGEFYARVRIYDEQGGCKVVGARQVLPEHMQDLYGYSRDCFAWDSNCHETAFRFIGSANTNNLHHEDVLRRDYRLLEEGEEPMFGDILGIRCFDVYGPQGYIVHSATVVGRDILASKNAVGPANPYLLQPKDTLLAYWSGKGKTEIAEEYWRKKE